MTVLDRVRLPLHFDLPALQSEVLSLPASSWVPHFNTDIYEGEWSGVALRSIGGVSTQLYPDPASQLPFADTEMLGHHPALRGALGSFHCPLLSARLLLLAPGAVINEHRDYRLSFADGEIRVHVPILTSDGVEFLLDGRRVEMAAGEAWYLNLNLPHSVHNSSGESRVHLVCDCVVDSWLTEVLESALPDTGEP